MKWKFNWGTGLTIFIFLFVGWILYLVSMSVRQRVDLVEEDYYPQELEFQDKLEKSRNYAALGENILVEQAAGKLNIIFPQYFISDSLIGTVHLYRPSDKRLDIKFPLKPTPDGYVVLPAAKMKPGKYVLNIDWTFKKVPYFLKQELIVKHE